MKRDELPRKLLVLSAGVCTAAVVLSSTVNHWMSACLRELRMESVRLDALRTC